MCKSQVELDVAPIISYKMQAQEQWVNGVLSGVEYSAEKRRLQTGSFLESRSRPALFISACWTATTALTASQPSHSHLGRAVLKFPWERL